MADAAALGAIISILMKLFPDHTSSVLSWTQMLFGLGYMMGKNQKLNLALGLISPLPTKGQTRNNLLSRNSESLVERLKVNLKLAKEAPLLGIPSHL